MRTTNRNRGSRRAADNLVSLDDQATRRRVPFSTVQDIRFRMDERGVKLWSQSIAFLEKASIKRHIIFNRPFLIYLRRKGAGLPYFAAWIEHPEIILPVNK